MAEPKPRAIVLYHFMYPDDVVSGRIFDGFCAGLVQRGWEVEAWPSNRNCRNERLKYSLGDEAGGVRMRRVWRPPFRQAGGFGRIANSMWMICAWTVRLLVLRNVDNTVVVVGSDPVLAVLVAALAGRIRPRLKIAHWCFDLYPEAAVADGLLAADSLLTSLLKRLLRPAYSSCRIVADIGADMRRRLECYVAGKRFVTLTPWAVVEPESPGRANDDRRVRMFGKATIGILYSGSYGRAHCAARLLELARRMRNDPVCFSFAVRGNRVDELMSLVTPEDSNVRFLDFTDENNLAEHLAAADIHVASLRPEWTGLVVPSKFFGSLAVGRPVIFEGSTDSSIAGWITQFGVGWVLDGADSDDRTADALRGFVTDRTTLPMLQKKCWDTYRANFRQSIVMDSWDRELRGLLNNA
jgi:colanic acid biosynthesis glycosyl transferase WcaI